jgi:fatty-acyl-CoA synthase
MEHQPLTDTSPTEQPYLARRQNWTNQLARHALMQPDATALRFLGHTTTWGELDRRSSNRSSQPTKSAPSPCR